jgi:hypothetical protein
MATFLKSTSLSVAARVLNRENETDPREIGHVKSSQLLDIKPKKKCCRSKPRCKKCPVVLHKVRKAELMGIRGKELNKIYKRARKN